MTEHGVMRTALGNIHVEMSGTGIRKLYFCEEEETELNDRMVSLKNVLESYFRGNVHSFDFALDLQGTPFQKQVWNALCEIPYGETRTYGEIAEQTGRPRAYRAVGMACNQNPVMILVPCHRVIGKNGSLTGYAGGLDKKKALLEIEGKIWQRKEN